MKKLDGQHDSKAREAEARLAKDNKELVVVMIIIINFFIINDDDEDHKLHHDYYTHKVASETRDVVPDIDTWYTSARGQRDMWERGGGMGEGGERPQILYASEALASVD